MTGAASAAGIIRETKAPATAVAPARWKRYAVSATDAAHCVTSLAAKAAWSRRRAGLRSPATIGSAEERMRPAAVTRACRPRAAAWARLVSASPDVPLDVRAVVVLVRAVAA